MKKKFLALLLAVVMLLQIVGCNNAQPTSTAPAGDVTTATTTTEAVTTTTTETTTEATTEKAANYPVTINFYTAKKEPISFTYTKSPEKTLVYGKNNVEILLALGAGDKIMMVADVKKVLPELQAELDKIPNIYDAQGINYFVREYALSLEPDMVIGWRSLFGMEDRMGSNDFWHERNIGTYINLNSSMRGTESLENEYQDIRNLAMIFDKTEKAEEIISKIQADVEIGKKAAEGKEPQKILILENWKGEYDVYPAGSVIGDIAQQLGAVVVGERGWTDEQIVAANPEAIYSVHVGSVTPEEAVALFLDNPALASVDAIKNKKVYPVGYGLAYTPGIRCGSTVKMFLKYLYGIE